MLANSGGLVDSERSEAVGLVCCCCLVLFVDSLHGFPVDSSFYTTLLLALCTIAGL